MSDGKVITHTQFREIARELYDSAFDAGYQAGYAIGQLEKARQVKIAITDEAASSNPFLINANPGMVYDTETGTWKPEGARVTFTAADFNFTGD